MSEPGAILISCGFDCGEKYPLRPGSMKEDFDRELYDQGWIAFAGIERLSPDSSKAVIAIICPACSAQLWRRITRRIPTPA